MKISKRIAQNDRAMKRRRRPGLCAKCLQALELPEDALSGQARVTLCGSSCALVENIRGIGELSQETVRLRLEKGEISLCGSELVLKDVRPDCLYVAGQIRAIFIEDGRP